MFNQACQLNRILLELSFSNFFFFSSFLACLFSYPRALDLMIYLWLTTYLFMKELNHSQVRVSLNRTLEISIMKLYWPQKWLDLSCFMVPMLRVNIFETAKQVDHTGTKYKYDEVIRFLTSPVNFQHTQGYEAFNQPSFKSAQLNWNFW